MTTDELKHICDLTVELTRLRQNEVKNLCVENFAPPLFESLLTAWRNSGRVPESTSKKPLVYDWGKLR